MFKKKKKWLATLIIMTLSFIINSHLLLDVKAAGLNFDVKIVVPENQLDKKKTYFDLLVSKGGTQALTYMVTNQKDKEIVVDVIPTVATTNRSGEVSYSEVDRSIDTSLEHPLTELVSKKQRVTLKAKEVKEVTFQLKVPEDGINGKVVGGFLFKEVVKKTKEDTEKGVTIQNNFVLVKGIELQEKETVFEPHFVIDNINAQLVNYIPNITLNIQNTVPDFQRNLEIKVDIKQKKKEKVIWTKKSQEINMAPNSNFDFDVEVGNNDLKIGDYVAEIVIKGPNFEKREIRSFEITSETVKEIKQKSILNKSRVNKWLIVLLVVFFSIAGLFFTIVTKDKFKKV